MLVVNAANTAKDDAIYVPIFCRILNVQPLRRDWSAGASGPNSAAILQKLADTERIPTGYYSFCEHVSVGGVVPSVSYGVHG